MNAPETVGFLIVLAAIVFCAGALLIQQWRSGALCPMQHERYPHCRCHRRERIEIRRVR